MKIVQLLFVLAFATVRAFQQVQVVSIRTRKSSNVLKMGFFENPFHGGGTADNDDLDEIWKTQQAILAARKGETKEHMRAKYRDSDRKFDVKSSMDDGKTQQRVNQVFVEEEKPKKKGSGGGFKMPWDK